MAYIGYSQSSAGGKQVAEVMADLQEVSAKLEALADWVGQIGPAGLEANPDFLVAATQGQVFNDTFVQIAQAFATWYGDGAGGTNREKISRLARGS